MKEPLHYLLQTLVCSGAFLLLYRPVVAGRTSFLVSRIYLVASALLSAVIPLMRVPLYPAREVIISSPTPGQSFVFEAGGSEAVPEAATAASVWWPDNLWVYIYAAGALVMAAFILREIFLINKIRRTAHSVEGMPSNVRESGLVKTAFSTARSIYLQMGLEEDQREQIVLHEGSHIRHGHFYERLLLTLLRAAMWFNPFMWIMRRCLAEVHEYEADNDVIASGCDITQYRLIILKQILGYSPDITCGLNGSLTKKRFLMMTKKIKKRRAPVTATASLALALGLMMLFGFTRKPDVVISPAPPTEQAQGNNHSAMSTQEFEALLDEVLMVVQSTIDETTAAVNADIERAADTASPPGSKADDTVSSIVEQMPKFNSGNSNQTFERWMTDNIDYLRIVKEKEISGTVRVTFIVEEDGSLSNPKIVASPDESLSEEVLRVLKKSPKWEPAKNDGKPIGINLAVDIEFILDSGEKPAMDVTTSTSGTEYIEAVFSTAEQMPKFNGGEPNQKFPEWMINNLYSSESTGKKDIAGTLTANFTVEKDGTLNSPKIIESSNKSLSEEILRIMKKSPKWEPAKNGNTPVGVIYSFKLSHNVRLGDIFTGKNGSALPSNIKIGDANSETDSDALCTVIFFDDPSTAKGVGPSSVIVYTNGPLTVDCSDTLADTITVRERK